jgi:hypothetical protein
VAGVSVTALPDVGARQLALVHRSSRTEPSPATAAVLEAVAAAGVNAAASRAEP